MVKILKKIKEIKLDKGTKNFQPSNLEITKISIDNNADNVIPGSAQAVWDRSSSSWAGGRASRAAYEYRPPPPREEMSASERWGRWGLAIAFVGGQYASWAIFIQLAAQGKAP